ncbi:protein phosphatase 2C domain-containing protein [Planomonospora sp. ID67723]|uniref:protein phosphatase 2C domain-containing protein n=1 Tax=Planomonospora sp. ID67723 TaxID=2738134 RepID=UPI0018C43EE1|nr:protein phosphatase 2C domain-containing protein [Planomonospora sp. ID67723]MBG0829679.1 protein phosphatase 2C domain-containing protein [Planomonospora sp. ID67723]
MHPGELFCECCGQPLRSAGCERCGPAPVDPEGYCERCGLKQPSETDHAETEAGGAAGVSDRGLRHSRNEDAMALVAADGLVIGVVCDGVSSSPRPESASTAAAETGSAVLLAELRAGAGPAAATRAAAVRAAAVVAALGSSMDDAPACTYVSAVVGPETVTVGWTGDSRAYWLRAEPPPMPSDDSTTPTAPVAPSAPAPGTGPTASTGPMPPPGSSCAGPVPLHDSALLTEDDVAAPSVLSAWLGADAGEIAPHVRVFAPEEPGAVLVCSDGLWGYLEDAGDLAPFTARDSPLDAARALVRHALAAGGRDNITVLVIPFCPPPS